MTILVLFYLHVQVSKSNIFIKYADNHLSLINAARYLQVMTQKLCHRQGHDIEVQMNKIVHYNAMYYRAVHSYGRCIWH